MSRINWDTLEDRTYEAGTDRGVLYEFSGNEYISGVPWVGLIEVDCSSSSYEVEKLYSKGIVSALMANSEELEGSIKCYSHPEEVDRYMGISSVGEGIIGIYSTQQDRRFCGFSYRTMFVEPNSTSSSESYKIHLLYNLLFENAGYKYKTINSNNTSDIEQTFEFTSVPEVYDDYNPTSEVIINTKKCEPEFIQALETILYGDAENEPRMPDLDEIASLYGMFTPLPEGSEPYPYEIRYPGNEVYPMTGGE